MSQGTVGASTISLSEVTTVATNTAALTGDTRTLAAQQGQKVQTEIAEAAEAFAREFDNIGTQMQNQITATSNNVQALAATGMSAGEARAAAGDFTAQIAQLQTTTQQAIGEFGGSQATTAADATQQELNDISTTLRTGFTQNIEALQAQFSAFRSSVATSTWDGDAKNRANGIADRYEALLRTVGGEATTAVTEFATQTNKEAAALRDGIGTEYKGLTDRFGDRYQSLGSETEVPSAPRRSSSICEPRFSTHQSPSWNTSRPRMRCRYWLPSSTTRSAMRPKVSDWPGLSSRNSSMNPTVSWLGSMTSGRVVGRATTIMPAHSPAPPPTRQSHIGAAP